MPSFRAHSIAASLLIFTVTSGAAQPLGTAPQSPGASGNPQGSTSVAPSGLPAEALGQFGAGAAQQIEVVVDAAGQRHGARRMPLAVDQAQGDLGQIEMPGLPDRRMVEAHEVGGLGLQR